MTHPLKNHMLDDAAANDAQRRYEAKIVRYLLSRYNVHKQIRFAIHREAKLLLNRAPTLELLSQHLPLPVRLVARDVPFASTDLTVAAALTHPRGLKGILDRYRDVRDSYPDDEEAGRVIAMCFPFLGLRRSKSASSLVIHDGLPSQQELESARSCIILRGDTGPWVIEPLGQLLDQLDDEQ